ncbi:MAG TPA: hypothetical protein VGF22_13100, partial [Acidimicrobiales bacterium]
DAMAQMLEGAGRWTDAEAAALEGRTVSARFGMRGWQCTMDTRLGELARLQGHRDRAESYYRAAVELAQELALPAAEATARSGLATVLAAG